MRYVSTKSNIGAVSFKEAVNRCIAADSGMFMPENMPSIPHAFFNNIGQMSLGEIAFVVASAFVGDEIDGAVLKNIVGEAFAFDAPLKHIGRQTYVLELFHGPTLTFKDYGARFMARLLREFNNDEKYCRNVIVATTGNTGAATANGLFRMSGISVSVLFPRGKLSRTQLSELTALGENIFPLEIAGSVEDCKRLVQMAMSDPSLSDLHLTGGNSINIARLIPQISFAFYAYAQMKHLDIHGAEEAHYCMPCGNMSNVVATAMAKKMGLPMGKIVGATAANNQLAPLLAGQQCKNSAPVRTLAHSIDMSYPSGWPRLECIYGRDLEAIRRDIVAAPPVSDDDIMLAMGKIRCVNDYVIDPHGAVAYEAAATIDDNCPKVIFATGHPAKQLDIVRQVAKNAEIPWQLKQALKTKRQPIILPPTLPALRKHFISIQPTN